MKAKEIIKKLIKEGWLEVSQVGSHKKFKHPEKNGIVIVPVHAGQEIPPGTLNSIKKQAGWK